MKKTIKLYLLARAAMMLVLSLLTSASAWAQLSNLTYNSAGGFYEIWSVADLKAMANYYNGFNGGDGKVFKMMQDIDLAGVNTSFLPIASANSENLFNDVFDGNDHKITGLSLVREGGKTYYGLFQQLGSSATVKNLTLVDCDVRYTGGINGTSVGAIAGRNRGTIQNCTVIGTVSNHDNEHCVGAIVGENISPGRVENCNAVAGQPVTGVLYSTSTPGTESGNHLYYRLLTTSAVSLTTTPAATTVAGTACYVANTALALTVTPNDGTQMLTDVSFTGTTATKTAYGQYTLTMPARDVSVTAALAAKISVSATGGTVTPNTYSPAVGSQVTLTLAPNTGYALTTIAATAGGTALTLNGSGLTRTFTMPDKPVSITATFSAVSYTVSGLGSKTGGRISGPGKAHYGDEVTLTAAPATGYSLQTLSVTTAGNQNVALSGSGNTRTFTMPAENVTVSATFALAQLTVHVTAYNCTATATPNPATMGQTVTVSITPDAGATLQSVTVRDADWNHLTVSGSGQTRTFTMPATDAYVTVACSSSGQLAGKGTQDEPYLIFNEADLRLLSSLSKTTTFWGTNFRLERDITMSDTPMLPIGDSSNGQFDGHFDGNGHTISNLHISGKVADLVALFGINFGSVSNLTLASCAITGNESGTFQIGAIVGYNIGTVSNCHVNSGTISATAAKVVGGIVSYNDGGTISGCTNGATVSQTARTVQIKVGGIVGNISSGTVKDCTNTGSVSGAGASGSPSCYCGGIAGYLYGGILSGCANTGSVSLTGSNVYNNDAGGVAGYIENRDAAICIGNTNSGAVSAANGNKNYAGGIVGYYFYSSYILKNNYYFGACTAKGSASYVGSGDAPQSDVTDNYGAVPGYAITKPAEVTLSSIEGYADVAHPAYAASGETVTFTVTVPEGYTATVKYNDGSDHALTATNGVYSFTMPAKAVTITVNFAPDPAHFSQSGTTYTIHTAAGWDVFCDALQDNDTYNRFSGKTVKLGADISVSRMAGGDYHDFLGIFDGGTIDGDRHKLTFTAEAKDSYLAPFSNVLGSSDTDHAVIRNLKVESNITANDYRHMAGLIAKVWGYVDVINCDVTVNINSTKGSTNTDLYPAGIASQVVSGAQLTVSDCTVGGKISTDGKYAGGIIGIVQGSAGITNSVSSVTIDSSTDGDGTHGGLVGVQGNYNGSTINIDGCVFNGELLGSSTTCCGGFIGWRSKTVNIYNSLFAPTEVSVSNEGSATFARNTVDTYNSYYTNAFYDATYAPALSDGTVSPAKWHNGIAASSITAGENVTVANAGTATNYSVSGITSYGTGIKYSNKIYAGSGDEVDLILSHTDREGYTFSGYTASAGTLSGDGNPYTLTMPNGGNSQEVVSIQAIFVEDVSDKVYQGKDITPEPQVVAGSQALTKGTDYAYSYTNNLHAGTAKVTVTFIGTYASLGSVEKEFTIEKAPLTITARNKTIYYGEEPAHDGVEYAGFVGEDREGVLMGQLNYYFTYSKFMDIGEYSITVGGLISTDYEIEFRAGTLTVIYHNVSLVDNADNDTAINSAATNGGKYDVRLSGRTLWKDGAWNTLCLPFDVEIAGSVLDGTGVEARTLTEASITGTTLNLTFGDAVTTLTAGVPYIIKWTKDDVNPTIDNPVFSGVTVSMATEPVETENVDFIGTTSPVTLLADDKTVLYLGADNTLYRPSADVTLNSCRAYFRLTESAAAVRAFNLSFGEEETTGIVSTTDYTNFTDSDDAWYDLSGRRLSGKPTVKGVYIHGGKKRLVK